MLKQLSRRDIVKGLAGGVPLAAVLADPLLAQAAAETTKTVTLTTEGGRKVTGALALPAKTPAAAVLLIHEWWGLNDQIKSVAAELAREGYIALACDLYDGRVAATREDAKKYMGAVDAGAATDAVRSWVKWLKAHKKATGKVGTIGWCFGGGWSLNASIAHPVDATVVYYGRVNKMAAELAALKGPVLGHFARRDTWINDKMVSGFEAEMKKAGKTATVHWYEADHAFANLTGARYDREDAQTSWKRTLAFFKKHL